MFALVVIANPSEASFSHAMADVAGAVLRGRGYRVARHDLYAEGFDPVQRFGESSNTGSDDELVEQHCRELSQADLVLVSHPNWWSQPPAILKGWVDRVFRPNTAYRYPEGVGFEGVPVGLLRARHALVFNTSNTPPEREVEVFGDPLDRLWKTSVFGLCGVHSVIRRMVGPIAGSTDDQRDGWLRDVERLTASVA
jgi:NAD(P)H dehydrogenase (quinone)